MKLRRYLLFYSINLSSVLGGTLRRRVISVDFWNPDQSVTTTSPNSPSDSPSSVSSVSNAEPQNPSMVPSTAIGGFLSNPSESPVPSSPPSKALSPSASMSPSVQILSSGFLDGLFFQSPSFPKPYSFLAPTDSPSDSTSSAPTLAQPKSTLIGSTTTDTHADLPSGAPSIAQSRTAAKDESFPELKMVGDNGFPSDAFPLGMCEGDCDRDRDCEDDLVCIMRDGEEEVPNCRGADSFANKDFCTDPNTQEPWSGNDSSYRFRLRLSWKPEYFWQETHDQTWWCMECASCDGYTTGDGEEQNCLSPGNSTLSCEEGHNIWIRKCKEHDYQFNIIKNEGSGDQIRLNGTNLCLSTVNNRYLEVRYCDNTSSRQLFKPIEDISEFEIRPFYQSTWTLRESKCLSQQHHPKDTEVVALHNCQTALNHETMFWEEYHR